MAEEISKDGLRTSADATAGATDYSAAAGSRWNMLWPTALQWAPTSNDHIIAAEKRLLSVAKTPYVQEQVNIGSGPPGSKISWFRSTSNEPRFINTVTFDAKEGSPTLVMIHGFGVSQGFFFRNFHALTSRFRVIAIDQLGFGGSSRPDFTCKSTEETVAWFIDSFEEWRKAKNLSNFILLGYSFGGYVAAKYALKHPEHIRHLLLVGSAGFSSESDAKSEDFTKYRATWKGAILNLLWEYNFTPQTVVRGFGPWGPGLVYRITTDRFGAHSLGTVLTDEESKLLTDYLYHTSAAKASGELCMKYIFSFGAYDRKPLGKSASELKVPTSFIYGSEDWMNYQGAVEARKQMKVPCEIIRVPKGGHFVFIDNPTGFHSAVLYACRRFISSSDADPQHVPLPEGLQSV
ncbi:PREDICTED: 1-acylglycerol-3-phosphate O-acyltransferase-like isoform X2 [Tarenaya hassleriana]|uniref:1-acylglycerol-3-phosphate O-acyltransferase-like isoform X2 n=1 Tax=Tarenaya hassleriana TaxID=28532 RepID=UPI00053C1FE4|nr:PREDICTED: 1-acylglycerol-3-phosphate O-acyltransferase-like isoform X2 [Tarenaya hassleriana]